MSARPWRRPPSSAWLRRYPQRSNYARNFARRPITVRGGPVYRTVARSRGPLAGGETKYYDAERDYASVPAAQDWTGTEFPPGTPGCLFAPTVGGAINQRIGRKVHVKKIRIHGMFVVDNQANQTAADPAQTIRMLLVQDTQANGTAAQGEAVMSATTNSAPPTAFQSLDTLGRFRVLKDKNFTFNVQNSSYDGTNVEQSGMNRFFKLTYKPKRPITVNFNATNGGTFADIVDNNFTVLCNADTTALGTQLTYTSRVYYSE